MTWIDSFQGLKCDPLVDVHISFGQHPLRTQQLVLVTLQAHFPPFCFSFFLSFFETFSRVLPIFHTSFMVWTSDIFLSSISDHLLLITAMFYHLGMPALRLCAVLMGLLSQRCASPDNSTCVPKVAMHNNPLSWTSGHLVLPQMLHIF